MTQNNIIINFQITPYSDDVANKVNSLNRDQVYSIFSNSNSPDILTAGLSAICKLERINLSTALLDPKIITSLSLIYQYDELLFSDNLNDLGLYPNVFVLLINNIYSGHCYTWIQNYNSSDNLKSRVTGGPIKNIINVTGMRPSLVNYNPNNLISFLIKGIITWIDPKLSKSDELTDANLLEINNYLQDIPSSPSKTSPLINSAEFVNPNSPDSSPILVDIPLKDSDLDQSLTNIVSNLVPTENNIRILQLGNLYFSQLTSFNEQLAECKFFLSKLIRNNEDMFWLFNNSSIGNTVLSTNLLFRERDYIQNIKSISCPINLPYTYKQI
jgi:hypothetical protein